MIFSFSQTSGIFFVIITTKTVWTVTGYSIESNVIVNRELENCCVVYFCTHSYLGSIANLIFSIFHFPIHIFLSLFEMKHPTRNVIKSVQMVLGVIRKRFVNVQSATWVNIVRLHCAIQNAWMVARARHQQFAAVREAIKADIVKEV